MKRKIATLFMLLFFLSGLSLLLYPFIADKWNTYRQKRLISSYNNTAASLEEEGSLDYQKEWDRARSYNVALGPSILPDSFAVAQALGEPDREYMNCLNISGDGMMGTVEIPKIDIELPIFHTTSEEVLEKGAGHLEGSSLPVGGESTHGVISAHRGLPSASLFTDLDQLEEGDHFLLHILDQILCYEVDKIQVVEPEETQDLAVEEGKDLVTLLTCTPYGVNSHRLLVRGHRVPYEAEIIAGEQPPLFGASLHRNYPLWTAAGLLAAAALISALYFRDKKRKKKSIRSVPDTAKKPGEEDL